MDAPSVDYAIQQALARDDVRAAARLLVLHHADAVYATCRAMVRDAHLSEDLSQEAFTKALAALPRFRGESQSRTWLLSITRNVCIDHLRRTKGPIDERAELDVEVHASEAPPPFEVLARRGDIERALAPLTEIERAIVVLHHAHGVGYPELAGSFGIAEGALRMRMSRALGKMRDALDEPASLAAPTKDGALRPSLGAPAPSAPPRASIGVAPGAARPAGPAAPAPLGAPPSSASAPSCAAPPPSAQAPSGAAPAPSGQAPSGPPAPRSASGPDAGATRGAPPPARARGSFFDRVRSFWHGAPDSPAPAPIYPMPEAVRERLLARIG